MPCLVVTNLLISNPDELSLEGIIAGLTSCKSIRGRGFFTLDPHKALFSHVPDGAVILVRQLPVAEPVT